MERVSLDRTERMPFWFPIAMPILMGMMLAFAELTVELARTSTLPGEHWTALVQSDLIFLWVGALKGVASAILAVDIWALTTLYANRLTRQSSANYAYAYPVLGMLGHFVLLLLVVGLVALAKGLMQDVANAEDPIEAEKYWVLANWMRAIATAFALLSVAVGWAVRRGVWIHYEAAAGDE